MTSPNSASALLSSDTATAALAARLAARVGPGDTILLTGPIGAGKTHFARALIQARLAAAGIGEDVPSPTFTLVQTYSDGETEIWHADLYRLTSADEIVELGLEEAFGTAVVLVEWPDRLGDLAPPSALSVGFEMLEDEGSRRVTASATDPRWNDVISLFEMAGAEDA